MRSGKGLNVNDTSPEAERIQREILMSKTPEERFLIGASMYESARTMVLASLPKDLGYAELRIRLYERFYGEPAPPGYVEALKKRERLLNER